jgi:hypothetical protein
MSRASQITLATTCLAAIGIVGFVHWSQKADKAVSVQSSRLASLASNISPGNAHGRHPRLRAATGEARTTGRLRDAAGVGAGVQEIPDGIRWRPCRTATTRPTRAMIRKDAVYAAVTAGVGKAHRHLSQILRYPSQNVDKLAKVMSGGAECSFLGFCPRVCS